MRSSTILSSLGLSFNAAVYRVDHKDFNDEFFSFQFDLTNHVCIAIVCIIRQQPYIYLYWLYVCRQSALYVSNLYIYIGCMYVGIASFLRRTGWTKYTLATYIFILAVCMQVQLPFSVGTAGPNRLRLDYLLVKNHKSCQTKFLKMKCRKCRKCRKYTKKIWKSAKHLKWWRALQSP